MKNVFLFSIIVVLLFGCANNQQHVTAYKKALQIALVNEAWQKKLGDGFCFKLYSSFPQGKDYVNYLCRDQVPKGYQFAVSRKTYEVLFKRFDTYGYSSSGNPFVCKVVNSINTKEKFIKIPIKIIKNKDFRFVIHKNSEGYVSGYSCSGRLSITKIVSATKPHFDSLYGMKTSVVTAYAGLIDTKQLEIKDKKYEGKMFKGNKKTEKIERNKFITITGLLGEEARNHWKVLDIYRFKIA